MSTNSEIYGFLMAQPGIAALVSDRIYPTIIPQNAAFPCLRFEREDDGGFKDFDGQGQTVRTSVQIDALAETLDTATSIADQVLAALHGYTGTLVTRYVQRSSLEASYDTFEQELAGGIYRVSQTWTLWHY